MFYLGLAMLFTHELDAIPNHEWRVLPLLRNLENPVGEVTFILAHIPVFAIVLACIASLNRKTRSVARDIAVGFLIVHAFLHLAFSGHPEYQFNSTLSVSLIYGAALCGLLYMPVRWTEKKARKST